MRPRSDAYADLGLVAYENGGDGYVVQPDRVVQICDPVSGDQLPHGETGEVVVTSRDAIWPMIAAQRHFTLPRRACVITLVKAPVPIAM